MRVITGLAKGRTLKSPQGSDVRPTSERTKEAVFSMLHANVQDCVFLDLFCGCGQMGIEALSRGAKKAYFVDASRVSQELTKENLATTKLFSLANVLMADAQGYLNSCKETFDIAFVDPPYRQGLPQIILPLLAQKMCTGGVIILETEKNEPVPTHLQDSLFSLVNSTNYGICGISVYRSIRAEKGE